MANFLFLNLRDSELPFHDSVWRFITTYVNATVTEKGRIAKRLRIDIIKDMVIVEKIPPTLAPIAV